ncbi:putative vacuolar protein sorting-associated protein 27-like [Capsicum annuum]|nr:putative vacuolar protein sorting-associated protein 27-like [Capsicum annuum]
MVVRSLDINKDPFRSHENNEELVGAEVLYLSAIGTLMYFASNLRSDISFAVLDTKTLECVGREPESCLRFWCSFVDLRISPLHTKFHSPLSHSSELVSRAFRQFLAAFGPNRAYLRHLAFSGELSLVKPKTPQDKAQDPEPGPFPFRLIGSAIVAKTALNNGMSHYTFAVYRNLFAAVVFAPFAALLERPVIDQNLYYAGMKYTTATFATAMCNILPAITFLLAWILRLENVNIWKIGSQAKIVGTIVTLGGATIMSLVGGPIIGLPWTKHNVPSTTTKVVSPTELNPIKGALFIAAGCFCWACFYNLQAITLKKYPAGLSLTSLICMAGALQGTALTLVVQRGNFGIWSLHLGSSKFYASLYCGIVTSGIGYYMSGLIMNVKGPVFVTSFNPLNMIIVAILGSFILSEQLNLGRVVGAAVIVVGLYLVIWGTGKDPKSEKKLSTHENVESNNEKELAEIKSSNQAVIGDESV